MRQIIRSTAQVSHGAIRSERIAHQSGFTLIELMVALLLGLLLIAGVLQIFLSNSATYRMNTALASLQENGRYAMTFISRDLRMAGYPGCSVHTTVANTLRDSSDLLPDYLDLSVRMDGLNNVSGAVYSTKTAKSGSDVVEVRFAEASGCDIDFHVPTSATLHCRADNEFKKGDLLVVTDCVHSAVFQKSGPVAQNKRIVHNTGSSTNIGNCTKGLGPDVDCSSTVGDTYEFEKGSVHKLNFSRYFIANNGLGDPSLYRQTIHNNAGESELVARELVEGIEDMQILYGEDTSGDGSANRYVPRDVVSDQDDVVSVRVSLLLRNNQTNLVKDSQTLIFNGVNSTYSDGYLRKVFTSTIEIRNKL